MSEKIPYTQVARRITSDIDYIMEEAYLQGKEQGVCDGSIDVKKRVEEAYQCGYYEARRIYQNPHAESDYQRGLDDAWEAAKKICTNWTISDKSLEDIFGYGKDIDTIMHENTASEAIAKIGEYEAKQKPDEIKVGDEVKDRTDDCGIVTWIYGNDAYVLWYDGSTGNYAADELIKTGRHFNFLASLLEAMKGEQRNCSACKHDGDSRFCDPCRHNDMWQPKEVTE